MQLARLDPEEGNGSTPLNQQCSALLERESRQLTSITELLTSLTHIGASKMPAWAPVARSGLITLQGLPTGNWSRAVLRLYSAPGLISNPATQVYPPSALKQPTNMQNPVSV